MNTKAYEHFVNNMNDISKLCDIDVHILQQHPILNKGILLTTVSAWETYIEDAIQEKAFSSIKYTKGSIVHQVFTASLHKEIKATNTPNAKVIKRLSKTFLGVDITEKWAFNNYCTSEEVAEQLQKWILKRGEAAHRMKDNNEPFVIKKKDLKKLLSFFNELVKNTDSIIINL
ncbi:TPA: HEPN domain-containing protein [Photobacterium damselae]